MKLYYKLKQLFFLFNNELRLIACHIIHDEMSKTHKLSYYICILQFGYYCISPSVKNLRADLCSQKSVTGYLLHKKPFFYIWLQTIYNKYQYQLHNDHKIEEKVYYDQHGRKTQQIWDCKRDSAIKINSFKISASVWCKNGSKIWQSIRRLIA